MVAKKKFLIGLLLVLIVCNYSQAELLVNEVMSNEPGSNTMLEWIELLNTDTTENFSMTFYAIDADGTTLNFISETVRGDEFVVVCQNLLAFESYWGDNSGSWGDDESENYPLFEKTTNFTLNNSSGMVRLFYLGSQNSSIEWYNLGSDGVSWERYSIDSSEVFLSVDPSGSTPGRANSRTPLPNDLSLISANSTPTDTGFTTLEFKIANIGLNEIIKDSLFLYSDPEKDTIVSLSDLIVKKEIPHMNPGDTTTIFLSFEFDLFYIDLLAKLKPDDRNNNNLQLFTAPGKNYPPIILSEVLADPTITQNEWIEIKNRSDGQIDITDWSLGKNDEVYPIAPTGYTMESGEYIVLCRDSQEFINFYGQPDFTIIDPTGWPSLNNSGDLIRLIDDFGLVADSLAYDSTFGDNYTWGRGEETGYTNSWGRSQDPGGTPGSANLINYPASSSEIKITLGENPYSPSHGLMEISFVLPPGDFNLKLYDIEGRVVKTFINNHYAYDGSIQWDGTSDGGRRLPVGIYILYAEVIGRESHKQTIVITP